MKYLLDSNAAIALLNRNQDFIEKIKQYQTKDFALSTIVWFELAFGQNDADCAARIRADLQRKGTPIGAYDVLIAGQALAHDLTLITHNVKEFARIPHLKFEDWL